MPTDSPVRGGSGFLSVGHVPCTLGHERRGRWQSGPLRAAIRERFGFIAGIEHLALFGRCAACGER